MIERYAHTPSFRRRPESILLFGVVGKAKWIPAFAGMTNGDRIAE